MSISCVFRSLGSAGLSRACVYVFVCVRGAPVYASVYTYDEFGAVVCVYVLWVTVLVVFHQFLSFNFTMRSTCVCVICSCLLYTRRHIQTQYKCSKRCRHWPCATMVAILEYKFIGADVVCVCFHSFCIFFLAFAQLQYYLREMPNGLVFSALWSYTHLVRIVPEIRFGLAFIEPNE